MHTIDTEVVDLCQDMKNHQILDKYQPYLKDYADRFGFEICGGFIVLTKENIVKIVDQLDGEEEYDLPVVLGTALLNSHQKIRDQLYPWGIKSDRFRNHPLFHDAHKIIGWLSQHFPNKGWHDRQKQAQLIEKLSFLVEFSLQED